MPEEKKSLLYFKIMKFYSLEGGYEMGKKEEKDIIGKVNYHNIIDIFESIVTETKGKTIEIKSIDFNGKKFDAVKWAHNEICGYDGRNGVPYYRVIRNLKISSPLHAICSCLIGKNIEQTIVFNTDGGPRRVKIKELIKAMEQMRIGINMYMSKLTEKLGVEVKEPEGIELPEELSKLYD